jgi:hypothetical protein
MPDRKFNRIRFESQATVRMADQSFEALTENLSLNGLYLRTDRQLPLGRRASISLNLPSASTSSTITVDGEVVRNDINGMAFQFKSMDFELFSHLKTVIGRKAPLRLNEYYLA